MNNTFNKWDKLDTTDINAVCNSILTGRNIDQFAPDLKDFKIFGDVQDKLKVLDFGCGIGRNTFGIADYSSYWEVYGYDNQNMLNLVPQYNYKKYGNRFFNNVHFSTNWDILKTYKFDIIYCSLVLQHIYEDALTAYLNDFKVMTKTLMVLSRRLNDECVNGVHKNTWEILEKNGLTPVHTKDAKYSVFGDPQHHMLCIYNI